MSTDRERTRIVRSWLEEGVTALPDRVLDAVLDQLPATRQRRSWWPARRIPTMKTMRFALAALLLAVAAFAGGRFAAPTSNTGSPTPAPTASTPSPTLRTLPAVLPPGTHATTRWSSPIVGFTVPVGWAMTLEDPNFFELVPASLLDAGGAQIQVYAGPRPVAASGPNEPASIVGSSVLDGMQYLAGRGDLIVNQAPTAWTLDGLTGHWMDVTYDGEADHAWVYVNGQDIYPGARNRFGVLELPDGRYLQITIFTFEGTHAYIDLATTIVESITFDGI